ncbi:MAG: DUF1642 domain-containing protein [Lactococcus lactis]|nr:DUF1642 domain-containing protein [Lactococcus lactis]MDN6317419.1 DUF1642 domain-containing protein [Lactococcus lactis]MDN6343073.1 DUF1642 domain-containing protein [Lactococcus lactis]
MTKFEEELEKLPIKIIQHPVGDTKYYAAVHVKSLIAQADEEFQELLSKYSGLNDNYEKEVIRSSKLESQIIDLKSQLQQQALPVVPEEVDKAIKYLKTQNNFATLTDLKNLDILTEKGFWWLNDFQFKDRRFGFGGLNNKLFILSHLAITGYTVEKPQLEKPQLFYLKHIDMSKSDAHLNWYLAKGTDNVLIHQGIKKGKSPKLKCILKLTQQEIDSMQTGSYELVPVEDGE